MRSLFLALALLGITPAMAATPVDVVPVDLNALIRAASGTPNQFAVNVPHTVTPASAGEWSSEGALQVWTYAVQVRGAVSLSFHAPTLTLPTGAILSVRSASTTTTYRAADAGRGDFWSRVQPGDTLEFRLELPAAQRTQLVLQISSFQAGFRGLSPDVPNHPLISRVRPQAAGDPDTPCVQNYACNVTPANSPPAQATVALLIGNMYQCTGTLINNIAQDNTPYILTARHCQNGHYGGGNPGAAATVTVYWNAQSNCGTELGTVFYVPQSARQTGATTVVEQQDAWLIQLDANPVVSDAQYAGFDASSGPVLGGYSIHHALSYNKQLTYWFGAAYASSKSGVLGTSFVSDLLDTVNAFGTTGPGASGAALFSSSNKLVGILSLGEAGSSTSGYHSCPAASLTPPDANHSDTSFVSFAAIWNSTADTSSSTGTKTLRSVLDPANTGALSVGSMPAARLTLESNWLFAPWNTLVTLTWSAANTTQCTATGGGGADGWTGSLPGSGSRTFTQSSGGDVTYRLRCDLAGGGTVSGSLLIHWQPPQAQPRFSTFSETRWTSRPMELSWNAVIGPCAITGGDVSQSNLPSSGTLTTTSNTPADITYQLTCGVPGFTQTTEARISYVTPNLSFAVTATRRKRGQPLYVAWWSFADSCVPTGGSPDDQWSSTTRPSQGTFLIWDTKDAGTFTYGMNCSSGPVSVQKSIQVTVDDADAFVTLAAEKSTVTLSNSPSDYIRLRYSSNIAGCGVESGRFLLREVVSGNLPPPLASIPYSEGEIIFAPGAIGTFTPTIKCTGSPGAQEGPVSATTSVTVLSPGPPTAMIGASAKQVAISSPFTITWSSTNASNCTATGGAPEQVSHWFGRVGVNGSRVVEPLAVQTDALYTITCEGIDTSQPAATASVVVSLGSPRVSLFATSTSPAMGASFTLSWNEPLASSCSASGGGANGSPWTGTLSTNGSVTHTASVAGTFNYTLTCIVNGSTRESTHQITVAAVASGGGGTDSGGTSGGSTSTKGGGGAVQWLEILALLMLTGAARRARNSSAATYRRYHRQ